MKYNALFLLIREVLVSASILATYTRLNFASQDYYIDPQHNLWLKVNMNGSTQHFNLYNTPSYSPNGDIVMWPTTTLAQAA